jgi:hypothetical protein
VWVWYELEHFFGEMWRPYSARKHFNARNTLHGRRQLPRMDEFLTVHCTSADVLQLYDRMAQNVQILSPLPFPHDLQIEDCHILVHVCKMVSQRYDFLGRLSRLSLEVLERAESSKERN